MNQSFRCSITGLGAVRIDPTSYQIVSEDIIIRHGIRFGELFAIKEFAENKHIFAGAILNRQIADSHSENGYSCTLTIDNFMDKLNDIVYPKTPKSKLDNLLVRLFGMQKYDGERIKLDASISDSKFIYQHFFKSKHECLYYLRELDFQSYIKFDSDAQGYKFNITYKGLNYYSEITEKGNLSKQCFIAMSFDSNMKKTRKAIKQAIERNGFEPVIIDEQLIDSAQTINDAIIAAIKSCKFCIADFSQQKDGVYFESGFAVGLGKPVIYTCQKKWFEKSHFDTNHFPHIIYDSNEELTDALDKKIKAWIK